MPAGMNAVPVRQAVRTSIRSYRYWPVVSLSLLEAGTGKTFGQVNGHAISAASRLYRAFVGYVGRCQPRMVA